jgi:prepilin-type N-terminal cleavage/methylation domain-containing protein
MQTQRGFTLLEVILSVSIISIALITIINCFLLIAQSETTVSNYLKALLLLDSKLYEINVQRANQYIQKGRFDYPFKKFSWYVRQGPTPFHDIRSISLFISWQQAKKEKKIELNTYLSVPKE